MKRWSKRLQDLRLSRALPRPAASRPSLPPEIVEMIIDILHSSSQSLSSCALVCNNWVPRVRHHQFTTLTICGSRVSEFIELLASPSSSLLECVITLQIGTAKSRWTPSKSIYVAISRLRRLETLKLHHFDVVTERMVGLGPLRQTCRRLNVEIRDGSFREGYQFLRMLCSFSKRKKMTLRGIPFFAIKDVPKNCFSFPMDGSLNLYHNIPHHFVEWVCLQKPVPSMYRLSLPSCGPAGGRLLKTIGKSLKEIQLMFRKIGQDGETRRHDEMEFFNSIDLSYNPNLRSLKFTHIFFESGESTQFLPILRLLGQIGSAPVAELSFEVTITQLAHLGKIPWDLLRDVVEERCAQLGKMAIALSVLKQTSRKRRKLTEEEKQEMEAIVRGRCGHGGSIEQKLVVDFLEQ